MSHSSAGSCADALQNPFSAALTGLFAVTIKTGD